MISLALAIHTIASVVWVGGMFFALTVLRPALAALPTAQQLTVWRRAFHHFFLWVWASIAVLLLTGYGVVFFGYEGFAAVGLHIHIMQLTGLAMVLLFVLMWAMPWQEFRHAVDAGHAEDALRALKRMRLIVSINMPLGLFTSAVGATGAFWSY